MLFVKFMTLGCRLQFVEILISRKLSFESIWMHTVGMYIVENEEKVFHKAVRDNETLVPSIDEYVVVAVSSPLDYSSCTFNMN